MNSQALTLLLDAQHKEARGTRQPQRIEIHAGVYLNPQSRRHPVRVYNGLRLGSFGKIHISNYISNFSTIQAPPPAAPVNLRGPKHN
jgi:hypothetical protein